MPQVVGRGGAIVLEAAFYDGAGNLVAPITPRVDIYNPSDVLVLNNGVPDLISLGRYEFTYDVPVDAPLGLWKALWTGTINGTLVEGEDFFTVVAAGVIDPGAAVPWITVEEANALTGLTLTQEELAFAAFDVYDFIRWEPDFDLEFLDITNQTHIRQKRALGHGIAWQAAYRQQNPPLSQMGRQAQNETIGDYSISFGSTARGTPVGLDVLPERVRKMLSAAGLCRWSGYSTHGSYDPTDEDTIIETDL